MSQKTVKNVIQNRRINQARCPDTRGHFEICPDGRRAEEGGEKGGGEEEEVPPLEAQGEEKGGEEGGEEEREKEVPRFTNFCEEDQRGEEEGEEGGEEEGREEGGAGGGEEEIPTAGEKARVYWSAD